MSPSGSVLEEATRRARATLAAFDQALEELAADARPVPDAARGAPPLTRPTLERELATLRSIARTLEAELVAARGQVSDWSARRDRAVPLSAPSLVVAAEHRLALAQASAHEIAEELGAARESIGRVEALLAAAVPASHGGG